jgi:hypothetical protein
MAANLMSNKVTDGIARLLQKTDVAALTRRDIAKSVEDAEVAMNDAYKCAITLVLQEAIGEVDVRDACWRFDIRCVLYLCKKGKASFEGREFKDLPAIQKEFILECNGTLQEDVKIAEFLPKSWPNVTPAPAPSAPAEKENPSDPSVVARKMGGFVKGALVFEKEVGSQILYEVVNVGAEITVEKAEVLQLSGAQPLQATMPLAVLVEKWAIFKGQRPQALLEKWGPFSWGKRSASSSNIVATFQAMCKLDEKFRANHVEALRFTMFPSAVVSVVEIKVGGLRLVPVADLGHLSTAKGKSDACGKVTCPDGTIVYVSPMQQPKTVEHEQWASSSALLPFWWVSSTARQADANMTIYTEQVDNVKVECMRNHVKLRPGVQLVVYRQKAKVAPLQGAAVVAPPGKRAKKE